MTSIKVKLGDYVEILSGYAFKSNLFNDEKTGIPIIRIRDVSSGNIKTYYSGEYQEQYVIDTGDLLITMDGEFKIKKWEAERGLLNQRVCKITSSHEDLETEYLLYLLPAILKKIEDRTAFVTVKHLSIKDIKETIINLPKREVQRKIVQILKLGEGLIAKRQSQMTALDELTKSVFLEMFGDVRTNNKKWDIVKLEQLVEDKHNIVDGPFGSSINTKLDYVDDGEIPVIRTKNVGLLSLKLDDMKYIKREKYELVKRSNVLPGDIVITKVGTIGNICVFPDLYKEAVLSTTGSCRVRMKNEQINNKYLIYYLFYYRDIMKAITSKGVQAFLTLKHIRNFDIFVPNRDLQNRFEVIVTNIENQKEIFRKSLSEYEALYNSILQKAFKGELFQEQL